MVNTSAIPSNMKELIGIFEKKYENKIHPEPIEADYNIETLFSHAKKLLPDVHKVWHLVSDEECFFHVWIVQTNAWERRSWRRQISRNFQLLEFADQLIFFVPVVDGGASWGQYSLTVISENGLDSVDLIEPQRPTDKISRFWEKLKADDFSLSDHHSISFAQQAANQLTAEKILEALTKSRGETLGIFYEAGLKIYDNRLIYPEWGEYDKVPINDLLIDVQPDEKKPLEFIRSNVDYYREARSVLVRRFDFVCLLTKNSLVFTTLDGELFGSEFIKEKNEGKSTDDNKYTMHNYFTWTTKDKNIAIEALTALIAVVNRRPAFNAETFASQFGRWSVLQLWALGRLLEYFNLHNKELAVLYKEWERRFSEVYQKNDTTVELFVKHSYLAYLVKLVLLEQYSDQFIRDTPTFTNLLQYLNDQGVSLFAHDFFHWVEFVPGLHARYYDIVHEADFDSADIFRVIYQQMVSPSTRHALGEFYTPPALAELMVDEKYEVGTKVLDPACGSGTFLVEIIKRVRRSPLNLSKKIEAIQKIYGVDVNPIAVAVSKANVLLQLRMIIEEPIPINVYLGNSVFPLETIKASVKLGLGEKEMSFPMHAVNQELVIPSSFYSEENAPKFKELLQILDLFLLKSWKDEIEFEKKLRETLSAPCYAWLSVIPKGRLVSNKEYFLKKIAIRIFNLCRENKNHIWSYLLFNSIGMYHLLGDIDLVIGNPPWLVLNGIYSKSYKERVKELAGKLGIKPASHLITHLEMSALFLYQANKLYLKEGGKVAFVVSNGFITGSQHDGTRKFTDFDEVSVWKFSRDIFNIHNICLFAIKRSIPPSKKKFGIQMKQWNVSKSNKKYDFKLTKTEIYQPVAIRKDGKGKLLGVEKYIDPKLRSKLLPRSPKGDNYYFPKCFNGSTIYPRPFVFCKIVNEDKKEAIIEPYMDFQSKKPWDFRPFQRATVEREYISKVAKSTELVPFLILELFHTFLPVNAANYSSFNGDPSELKPLAGKHFKYLKRLFTEKQKEGAAITDFWTQINYQNKLATKRQFLKYKVITPTHGGFVKSALIRESDILIDFKFFFVPVNTEMEGLFIVGVFNAPCVTVDIKIRASEGAGGGTRALHKRPWEINIPPFDPKEPLHQQIVTKARDMESKARACALRWRQDEFAKIVKKKKKGINYPSSVDEVKWKPRTVQNRVIQTLENDYEELDRLVLKLFGKE